MVVPFLGWQIHSFSTLDPFVCYGYFICLPAFFHCKNVPSNTNVVRKIIVALNVLSPWIGTGRFECEEHRIEATFSINGSLEIIKGETILYKV